MKIYHVETQEDYNALMVELESEGLTWTFGTKPKELDVWERYRDETCIKVEGKTLSYADIVFYKNAFPNIPIVKYKAYKNDVKSAIETVSQNNAELFHKIITNLEQTYLAKNKDYRNSFEKSLDKRGRVAGIVQLEHKMNRADEIMRAKETKVKDESEIDTYLDMAVYNIMMAMWLMKQEV